MVTAAEYLSVVSDDGVVNRAGATGMQRAYCQLRAGTDSHRAAWLTAWGIGGSITEVEALPVGAARAPAP
jgi:hypothetical protein